MPQLFPYADLMKMSHSNAKHDYCGTTLRVVINLCLKRAPPRPGTPGSGGRWVRCQPAPDRFTAWILLVALWLAIGPPSSLGSEPRQWPVELRIGRFEIHADFELTSAPPLTPELSQLPADIEQLLEIEPSQQPVHIVLFATPEEYQRYMHNYFPQLPQRRALYIQDRGPGMLFAHCHSELANDLRHELTHALLNETPQPLPLWLDEGLAEYFEVEQSLRFNGKDYLKEIAHRCDLGLVPSLKQLEAIDQLANFKEDHYRDSWGWVHYFLHRSSASRQALVRYLAEHRSGGQPLPLSRLLAELSSDTNADFQSHFLLVSASQQ